MKYKFFFYTELNVRVSFFSSEFQQTPITIICGTYEKSNITVMEVIFVNGFKSRKKGPARHIYT